MTRHGPVRYAHRAMIPFSPGQILDLAAAMGAALFGALVILVPALAPLAEYVAPAAAFAFAGAAFARFVASVRASGKVVFPGASERGHSQLRIMYALLLAGIAGVSVVVGCAQLDRLSRAADAYCEKDKAPDEAGSSDESAGGDAEPEAGSESLGG